MKGQGSTEYLVIFATALVVALIVISLLGGFVGFGIAGMEQQSQAYWRGITPFSIQSIKMTSGEATIAVQNKMPVKLYLNNIKFEGHSLNVDHAFSPGEMYTLTSIGYSTPCEDDQETYMVNDILFMYDDENIDGQIQRSDRPLFGKCA